VGTAEPTDLAHHDVPGFILVVELVVVSVYHVPIMFGAGGVGSLGCQCDRLAVRDAITGFWALAMHSFQSPH
jgi:hypothetical protein